MVLNSRITSCYRHRLPKRTFWVSCVPETGQELTNLKETEFFVAFNDFMFTTLHKHKSTKCKQTI